MKNANIAICNSDIGSAFILAVETDQLRHLKALQR